MKLNNKGLNWKKKKTITQERELKIKRNCNHKNKDQIQ